MVPLFPLSAGRFVLLRHELPPGHSLASHWDLMFERGDLLLTFQLFQLCAAAPCELAAKRLPEHRRLYLDYEGEVAGGRGTVSRVAAGEYRVVVAGTDASLESEVAGAVVNTGCSVPSAALASDSRRTCVWLKSSTLQASLEFEQCQVDQETTIHVRQWR